VKIITAKYAARCAAGKSTCTKGGKVQPGDVVLWEPRVAVHLGECWRLWKRRNSAQQSFPL